MGNAGGFSGARLWRVETETSQACLRLWPSGSTTADKLTWIHHLLEHATANGIRFVPCVFKSRVGQGWVKIAERFWDLTSWMTGTADFHVRPTRIRLEAACTGLARLHEAWHIRPATHGTCPALIRRLELIASWKRLVRGGWRPSLDGVHEDPVSPWAKRAWDVVRERIAEIEKGLGPWMEHAFVLQPCVCDLWHDHVLFEGDLLSGIIDFGSVKLDHVTIDLARLLGSLVGDRAEDRAAGLAAYGRIRPLGEEEAILVDVLDRSGTVLGIANWLIWLYHQRRRFDDPDAVARRLGELVRRVERWR